MERPSKTMKNSLTTFRRSKLQPLRARPLMPRPKTLLKLLLCLLLGLLSPLPSSAKNLGADPFSISWDVSQDNYRCFLHQVIPRFGRIGFGQEPEAAISFDIDATTPLYRGTASKLKATAPSWRSDLPGYAIAHQLKPSKDAKQASLSEKDSALALKAMRDGLSLQLDIVHGAPAEQLHIAVQGLGFNAAFADFEQCRLSSNILLLADRQRALTEKTAAEELAKTMAKIEAKSPKVAALTDGDEKADGSKPKKAATLPEQLANLPDFYRIPFDNEDTELSGGSAGYLDQLLRRWQLGGMPEGLLLHGHADEAESTANYINSDMRAQSVARYLLSKMPELKMRIEAHGDTLALEDTSAQRVDVVPSDLPNWE